jgi:hypothetical protein
MTGRKTSQSSWNIAITVAIVFVASTFALFSLEPEQLFVWSDDSIVTLSALTRTSEVEIKKYEGASLGMETVYELQAAVETLVEDGVLTVAINDPMADITELSIYQYDRSSLSWVELPTGFDLANLVLSAPFSFSGSVLIGVSERRLSTE